MASGRGSALGLLIGGPVQLYVLAFGLLCLGLRILVPYQRCVPYLKWLCLALFWSAVINGSVAAPLMVMIMILATRRRIMGDFTLAWRLKLLGGAPRASWRR